MTYPFADRNNAGMMPPRLAELAMSTLIWSGTSTGSANAQVIRPEFSGVLRGHPTYVFVAGYTNTGATTLSIDGGATSVSMRKADGTAMVGGEIVANTAYTVVYDGTYWRLIGGTPATAFPVISKSSAYTVTTADAGKMIVATGTWALTLPATSALSNGFAVHLLNLADGIITITPSGSDTVNGVNAAIIEGYKSALLVCSGSAWYITSIKTTAQFSPIYKGSATSLSNENRTATFSGSGWNSVRTVNPLPTSGKYYWEMLCSARGTDAAVAVVADTFTNFNTDPTATAAYRGASGDKQAGSGTTYGATWTANDTVGVAFDRATGSIWFSKNGVWQASGDPVTGANPAFTGLSGALYPAVGMMPTTTFVARFRPAEFVYSAPSGFSPVP